MRMRMSMRMSMRIEAVVNVSVLGVGVTSLLSPSSS